MIDEKKKMTAHGSSVGADDGQSISTNSKFTIPDLQEKSNSPERDLEELYRKMRRMSDPAYLHTVTLDELMDNVFEGKSAVIENLLYTGAYPCRSAQNRQVFPGGTDRPPCQYRARFMGLQSSPGHRPLSCSGR